MNTLTARHTLDLAAAPVAQRRVRSAPVAAVRAAAHNSWIERLADWADRQPVHRRVGSWVLYR
jgi:hypothetical protein